MVSFSAKNSTLIFLFFTLLVQLSILASAKCHVDDESGLLAFKKGIISDPSGMLSKWVSGTDCCTWPGISCSDNDRIIQILRIGQFDDPINSYLTGTISPSLSKLTHLQAIDFNNLKNLSGPFPSFLLSLPNIEYIHIENNKLSGKLPENLGKLSKLIELNLAGNRFSGRIPSSIGGLTQLVNLFLDNNLLTGPIPVSFKALQNITSLRLNNNRLSGAIPDFLGEFQALETLNLSRNKFSGTVPKTFSKLTKVANLDLSHNSLVDPFPQMNVKDIQSLDLSYNKFKLVNIPKWVVSSSRIEILKLAKCGLKLKMDDFKPVETDLYDFIDLSENEITGSPIKLLNSTTNLLGFYGSGNKLKFNLGRLKISTTLQEFDISRNLVFGKVPKEVAGLRVFNASHNHLCGQLPVTKFGASAFSGNDCLCGSPLPACKA